jgi:hypothetical protein
MPTAEELSILLYNAIHGYYDPEGLSSQIAMQYTEWVCLTLCWAYLIQSAISGTIILTIGEDGRIVSRPTTAADREQLAQDTQQLFRGAAPGN